MKTLALAQFGIEELTNQEMIDHQGGTSSGGYGGNNGSLVSIGSISVSDIGNVHTGDILSGNALFSGNSFSSHRSETSSYSSKGCGC